MCEKFNPFFLDVEKKPALYRKGRSKPVAPHTTLKNRRAIERHLEARALAAEFEL